ncbi:MAG: hypothetical protein H6Q89_118 [Myxococcaceae bacterium]|nr:hypothetical protein [Myxococcaceae bacterium]
MTRAVLLGFLLGLAGCKAGAPKLEQQCTFHQDCTLTTLGRDCCDQCESSIGTVGSVAALRGYCEAKPAASCPRLDCPNEAGTAFCENGRCLKRQGVH